MTETTTTDGQVRKIERGEVSPLEEFHSIIMKARTGSKGLRWALGDDRINAAAARGERITTQVLNGDVVLVRRAEGDEWIAFVDEDVAGSGAKRIWLCFLLGKMLEPKKLVELHLWGEALDQEIWVIIRDGKSQI